MTALPSHVQELADRVAAGHGVEVLELDLRGQGRGRVLSVILDAEEPVEADVVELVSKDLSRALDEADPVAGSYTLEVSTPGLSRPLHTRRDFRRQRGHEVSIVRNGEAADPAGRAPPRSRAWWWTPTTRRSCWRSTGAGPGAAVRGGSREGGVAVVTRYGPRPTTTGNERTAT